jgi:hypothetical protein
MKNKEFSFNIGPHEFKFEIEEKDFDCPKIKRTG